MKIKFGIIAVLLVCAVSSYGQTVFHRYFEETLLPGHRISGNLDSVDYKLTLTQTNLPGSFTPYRTNFSFLDLYQYKPLQIAKRTSAIPHVAFGYSMGSRLYQVGKITYTQTIDTNSFLQFDYNRISSNGAMQRNSFESNQVDWSFMHRRKHYGTELDFLFFSGNYTINGGLLGDSLANELDLIYQPIKKENAGRIYKNLQVNWTNYISFLKVSTDTIIGNRAGILVGANYAIANSRYTEVDTLAGLYSMINEDTLNTNDYWEKSAIAFPLGLFFSNQNWSIKAGVKYTYWDFDNRINHLDTSEVSAFAGLEGITFGWNYQINGSYTFLGANGESSLKAKLTKAWKVLEGGLFINAGTSFPQIYQRVFWGNNANYSWTNKVLTNFYDGRFTLKYTNRILPLELTAYTYNANNAPRFADSSWISDAKFGFNGIQLRTCYTYKRLLIQAQAALQNSTNNFLPQTVVSGRLAYYGPLFKAKKLKTVTGIELGQIGAYDALAYIPYMHTYQYASKIKTFTAMPKLSFYSSFDLGYFRWFLRLENIEQAIIHSKNQEAIGYQVVPMQIRFGVSWDFFN